MAALTLHFKLLALIIAVADCLRTARKSPSHNASALFQRSRRIKLHHREHSDFTGAKRLALLPFPASLKLAQDTQPFKLVPGVQLSVGGISQDDPSVVGLKALLARVGEAAEESSTTRARGSISMRLVEKASMGAEAYKLRITDKAVELEATGLPGLFYGVQTLRQLTQKSGANVHWPAVTISDAPRFAWRGLHLDVSRHFFKAEDVKKLLGVMASFKMNRFHWHLTDDQGWRLPVDGYPKLTEVGGQGKAYSKEEIKDVVAFAQARHIEVIPEIDVPGHVEAALAAYPSLGNVDIPQRRAPSEPRKAWGVSEYTLAPSNATWAFLGKVYDTATELFPSRFVHVGGDEVVTKEWEQSPAAVSFMSNSHAETSSILHQSNLGRGKQVETLFTSKLSEMLKARSRRVCAWNEAQHGAQFPSDGIVVAWTAANEANLAVRKGRQVIIADSGVLYFDHAQAREGEPTSIGGCTSWQNVYRYDPMPAGLTEAEQKLVLGAQGQLWSEYIPTWRHMEYMAHPRSLALAERVWTPPSKIQGVTEFEQRLRERVKDLNDLGVNYRQLGGESC